MTERIVGLVVLTESPELGLVAVLREKPNPPSSELAIYQITVEGELEEGKNDFDCLFRKAEKQLGAEFALFLKSQLTHLPEAVKEIYRGQRGEKPVVYYGVKLDYSVLKMIRLTPGWNVRLLKKEELGKVLTLGFGQIQRRCHRWL
jgi:hypothetical protein